MLVGAKASEVLTCAVTFDDASTINSATSLSAYLRRNGISTEVLFRGSVSKQFEKARKLAPEVVVVVGFQSEGRVRVRIVPLLPEALGYEAYSDVPKLCQLIQGLPGAEIQNERGYEVIVPKQSLEQLSSPT